MSLEPYGPTAALIALAFLTVIAFLWARAALQRAAPPAQAHAPRVAEYVMAAPVELWFGETRVAVRAGSETEKRFLGFGAALLEELEAARGAGEVMRRRESPDILR
ncbi:MAG TPA: hypothetical protein VFH17_06325 [Coriobacteriia bacterium]|nr:hypothetical protein [Coriobacteriia bacterium]